MSLRKAIAVLAISVGPLPSCHSIAEPGVPRATPDADTPITLRSDQDDTLFYVDGHKVGRGRTLRVLVRNNLHEIGAEPPGYRTKETTIQPPYDETYEHAFTFLLEDRLAPVQSAGAVARSDSTPALSIASPVTLGTVTQAAPQLGAYALVIGVEHYRELPPPDGARADAESFVEVLEHVFGLPANHVRVAVDDHATKVDIEKNLDWLKANVPSGSRVYFFFSGHGSPDPSSGTPYLVPYDGDPSFLERTGVRLSNVIAALSETRATDVIAFVDACYSGSGGRSVLPKGARPLLLVRDATPKPKLALLSAASGAEISGPTPDGRHGLFSATLVDGLASGAADADGDGRITLAELVEWVRPRVGRVAMEANREQHPTLVTGTGLGSPATVAIEWGLPTK